MIFVTIGTQAPFDRLIETVDRLAPLLGEPVVAQTLKGTYEPKNIELVDFISPDRFSDYINRASLVIAHAGMGTVITAIMAGKTLVIVPRKASLGEHRNEHQLATAKQLKKMGYVNVAFEVDELENLLINREELIASPAINQMASQGLIDSLTSFILNKK